MATNVRSGAQAFTEHCEWTGASADDRETWLLARRQGVGGSDVAAIMGASEFSSALSVYVEKTSNEPPDETSSEVAQWGQLFEPLIIKEFGKRSGRRVVRAGRLLRSKRAPHYLVTLDGVQLSKAPSFARGPGVLEIKTTGYGQRYAEDLPAEVLVQIQWELFVTGASWATCAWLPFPERKLQWLDVAPHPEFHEVLAERVDEFWGRVQRRDPPDPDGSESSVLALRKLYPDQTDEVIRIVGASSVADEYERIKAAIKVLEDRKATIRNMLAATIREARYAVLDDGRYWGASYYRARENRCPHCSEVLSKTEPYRTYALREPRKKPFPEATAVRELPAALTAEPSEDLTKALAESFITPGEPANDEIGEAG